MHQFKQKNSWKFTNNENGDFQSSKLKIWIGNQIVYFSIEIVVSKFKINSKLLCTLQTTEVKTDGVVRLIRHIDVVEIKLNSENLLENHSEINKKIFFTREWLCSMT